MSLKFRDKVYKIKVLIRIIKGKKVKTPIFIENSPENFSIIFRDGDFKMIPFPELTEKEEQSIEQGIKDFIEKINEK